jgi:hypothetical protein
LREPTDEELDAFGAQIQRVIDALAETQIDRVLGESAAAAAVLGAGVALMKGAGRSPDEIAHVVATVYHAAQVAFKGETLA